MEQIVITEVGMRDGLQNQPGIIPTASKLKLLDALIASGLTSFEVTSFVRPDSVPQLADAEALVGALPAGPDLSFMALVPNFKGYQRARAAGMGKFALVLAATETLNQKNINMSLEKATQVCEDVIRQAKADGHIARAYVAAAVACPFEGKTDPAIVHALANRLIEAGADEIAVADTIGAAHPAEIRPLFEPLIARYGAARIGAHFHDTRGLGQALLWEAVEAGVRRFDGSIGGLGGCPFAPGASGNVATEDLVFLFENAGFSTGVDLERLIAVLAEVEAMLGKPYAGKIVPWLRSQRARLAARERLAS